MNIRFYVDPETEAPHIYRHGIDEEEVIDVLSRTPGEAPMSGGFAGRNRQDTGRGVSSRDLCFRRRNPGAYL